MQFTDTTTSMFHVPTENVRVAGDNQDPYAAADAANSVVHQAAASSTPPPREKHPRPSKPPTVRNENLATKRKVRACSMSDDDFVCPPAPRVTKASKPANGKFKKVKCYQVPIVSTMFIFGLCRLKLLTILSCPTVSRTLFCCYSVVSSG